MSKCKAVNGVGESFVDKDNLWSFCHCETCKHIEELKEQLRLEKFNYMGAMADCKEKDVRIAALLHQQESE